MDQQEAVDELLARHDQQAGARSLVWWTQPKLALIALAGNAVALAGVMLTVPSGGGRLVLLAGIQVVLVAAYRLAAVRQARRHLAGGSEDAFDRNLWNKRWRPFNWEIEPPPADAIPRRDGGSFYRQVLGDRDEARAALYRALALWEGSRLAWLGGTFGVAAALTASTVVLAVGRAPDHGIPAAFAAITITPWVLVLPEALNILMLRRRLLRHGLVARAASLLPRDARDLGLRADPVEEEFRPQELAVMAIALGAPILMIIGFLAGVDGLLATMALVAVAVLVIVMVRRAFLRLVVDSIPFVRFGTVPEVNVLLDLAHRQRAWLSLGALALSPWVVLVLAAPLRFGTQVLVPLEVIVYLAVISFGDQVSGYAGFVSATRFEMYFRRSLAKCSKAEAAGQ